MASTPKDVDDANRAFQDRVNELTDAQKDYDSKKVPYVAAEDVLTGAVKAVSEAQDVLEKAIKDYAPPKAPSPA